MTGPPDPPPTAASAAAPHAAAAPVAAGPPPPAEPRQRWRLTFARDAVPADQVGRVALDAWQAALVASGLPLAGLDPGSGGRARIAFAAPLPAAARAEAELADLWLVERRPVWALREALASRLPAAHRWVSAEDVWLGAPALAGQLVAADWRIELAGAGLDRERIAEAARGLIAARTLPRVRMKGNTEKRYDLRPLVADVAVEAGGSGGTPTLLLRTRFSPELGAGRPEDIVSVLAESCGVAIEIGATVRTRLLLADELAGPSGR